MHGFKYWSAVGGVVLCLTLLMTTGRGDEAPGGSRPKPIRINLKLPEPVNPYAPKPLPKGLNEGDLLHHYTSPDVRDGVTASKRMPWGPSGQSLHVTNYPPGRGPAGGIGTPANDKASIVVKAGDLAKSGHTIVSNNNPNYEQGKNWLVLRDPGQKEIRLPDTVRGGAGYKRPGSNFVAGGGGNGNGFVGNSDYAGSFNNGGIKLSAQPTLKSAASNGGAAKVGGQIMTAVGVASSINNIATSDNPGAQTQEEISAQIGGKLGAVMGSEFGPVGSLVGGLFGDLISRTLVNPQPPGPPIYQDPESGSADATTSRPATDDVVSTPALMPVPYDARGVKPPPLGPAPEEVAPDADTLAEQERRSNQLAGDTKYDQMARDMLGEADARRQAAAQEAARRQQVRRSYDNGGYYGGYDY